VSYWNYYNSNLDWPKYRGRVRNRFLIATDIYIYVYIYVYIYICTSLLCGDIRLQ
jgi:hypothetical protein